MIMSLPHILKLILFLHLLFSLFSSSSFSSCSFQDFDLQGSHRCSSDWMSVSSYRSLEGLRVCGSSLPPPFTSSQDHVWIHFHSDDSLTGKGFRLSYISGEYLDSRWLSLLAPLELRSSESLASCQVDHFH